MGWESWNKLILLLRATRLARLRCAAGQSCVWWIVGAGGDWASWRWPGLGTRLAVGGERIRYIIIIIIIVVVIVNIIMNIIEIFKKLSMVACNSFVGGGGGGFSAFLVLWGLTLPGAGGKGKGI